MANKAKWNKPSIPRRVYTDDQIRRMFNEGMNNLDVVRATGLSEYKVVKAKRRIFGDIKKGEVLKKPPRAFPAPDSRKVVVEFDCLIDGYIYKNYVSLARIPTLDGRYDGDQDFH